MPGRAGERYGLVEHDTRLQSLRCRACGTTYELSRKELRDPELVMMKAETMRDEHEGCREYAHDPRMAKLQFDLRQRLKDRRERGTRP